MDIGNSLRRKGHENTIIKSLCWSAVQEVYTSHYNSDRVKKYLISVQISGNTCIVKTQKPIIISELLPLSNEIQKKLSEKFQKVGIGRTKINFKFI